MKYKPKKNKLGFYQASPLPNEKYLEDFYRKKYFNEKLNNTYNIKYNKLEIKHKKLRAECTLEFIISNLKKKTKINLLEIGCGEGYLLSSAKKKKIQITGVDYQTIQVKRNNPNVLKYVKEINPNYFLNDLLRKKINSFDIIILQNVLEHVLFPEKLLKDLKKLMRKDDLLFIQVPNDYSLIQLCAIKQKRIKNEFWFTPPQHLNFFNKKSLTNFVEKIGFNVSDAMTDFPVDIFLWGNKKNYINDKKLGKYAHMARLNLDLLFSNSGIKNYINFYRQAYNINLGRNLCVLLKKK